MKTPYKYILLVIILAWVLVNVSAYQVGNNNVQFTCKIINPVTGASQVPSNSATYNFSVSNSNGTTILNNVQADSKGQGEFNYTINFPYVDTYLFQERCYDTIGNSSNQETLAVSSDGSTSGITILIFLFIGGFAFLILSMFGNEELFIFISGVLFLVGGMYSLIYGFGDYNRWFTEAIGVVGVGVGILLVFTSYLNTIRDDEDEKSWDSNFDEDD